MAMPTPKGGGPTNGIGLFNLPFTTTEDELMTMLQAYTGGNRVREATPVGANGGLFPVLHSPIDVGAHAQQPKVSEWGHVYKSPCGRYQWVVSHTGVQCLTEGEHLLSSPSSQSKLG